MHRLRLTTVSGLTAILTVLLTAASGLGASDELAAREASVRELTPLERRELLAKSERFSRLSVEEQQRLRDLHGQVEGHPNAVQLQRILVRYGEWLSTLTASQRAKLESLPADERIAEIARIKRRSEERMLSQLTQSRLAPEDARRVFAWLDRLVAGQEDELRSQLKDNETRWLDMIRDPEQRRGMLVRMVFRQRGSEALPPPDADQVKQLVETLSSPAQKQYEAQETDEARQALVREWIQAALLSRLMPPPVSDEELQRFYLEDLPADERDELDRLPREMMMRELYSRYVRQHLRRRMSDGGPPFGGGPPWERPGRRNPRFGREGGPRGEDRGGPRAEGDRRGPPRRPPPLDEPPPPRDEQRPELPPDQQPGLIGD